MLEAEVGQGLAHLGGRIAADLIAEASSESTYADPKPPKLDWTIDSCNNSWRSAERGDL